MRRGGFDRNDIKFISGHKSVNSLEHYDALTVHDRTKVALAIQNAPATLEGEKLDLDNLARGKKRKSDDPVQSTSKKVTFTREDIERAEFVYDDSGLGLDNASQDFHASQHLEAPKNLLEAVYGTGGDRGIGAGEHVERVVVDADRGDPAEPVAAQDTVEVRVEGVRPAAEEEGQPGTRRVAKAGEAAVANHADSQEHGLPSSQAHNIAQLIRDQMNLINNNKDLINNYISAMKKK